MTRRFNGWHMASILVGFFAVVIAVNLVMARYAVGTFGGTVVENSYVASQNYNRWLNDAKNQRALGWSTRLSIDGQRRVIAAAAKGGAHLQNLHGTGSAIHPLGREPSIELEFDAQPDGSLRARRPLPPGRWSVAVTLRQGNDLVRLMEPMQ